MIHAKLKEWKDVIKYADEALTVDPEYVKALYHKGRALLEMTEYANGLEVLKLAASVEPANEEVKREIKRGEEAVKKHADKETKMF